MRIFKQIFVLLFVAVLPNVTFADEPNIEEVKTEELTIAPSEWDDCICRSKQVNRARHIFESRLSEIAAVLPFAEGERKNKLTEEKESLEGLITELEFVLAELENAQQAKSLHDHWERTTQSLKETYEEAKEELKAIERKMWWIMGGTVLVVVGAGGFLCYLLKKTWEEQNKAPKRRGRRKKKFRRRGQPRENQ